MADWEIQPGNTTRHLSSESLAALFGRPLETFDGAAGGGPKFMHQEDAPRVRQALEDAIANQSAFATDFRVVLPDRQNPLAEHKHPGTYRRLGNRRPRMLGITTDVTERRTLEDSSARRRRWRPSAGSPAASRTTSTTCSTAISATASSSLGDVAGRRSAARRRRRDPEGGRARRRPDAAAARLQPQAGAAAEGARSQRAWSATSSGCCGASIGEDVELVTDACAGAAAGAAPTRASSSRCS